MTRSDWRRIYQVPGGSSYFGRAGGEIAVVVGDDAPVTEIKEGWLRVDTARPIVLRLRAEVPVIDSVGCKMIIEERLDRGPALADQLGMRLKAAGVMQQTLLALCKHAGYVDIESYYGDGPDGLRAYAALEDDQPRRQDRYSLRIRPAERRGPYRTVRYFADLHRAVSWARLNLVEYRWAVFDGRSMAARGDA